MNQPNIVFIITDQQRYDSLGCTGNPHAVTPHLDHLAAQGTVFERCLTTSAICSPSRASMLTGLQCSQHGVWTNGVALPRAEDVQVTEGSRKAFPGKWVASHIPTFADAFRAAGYHTASIGKLHVTPYTAAASCGYREADAYWAAHPAMNAWHGPYYGIEDVWLTTGHGENIGGHYGAWLRDRHPEVIQELHKAAQERVLEFPEVAGLYPSVMPAEVHHSTWIGERACAKIRSAAAAGQPFMLWVGFPDPHLPFVPPRRLAEEFSRHDVLGSRVPAGAWDSKPGALRNLIKKRNARASQPEAIRRCQQYTDAMLHLIDSNVGNILGALESTGLRDNTMVVFTSDHGDFLGDYGLYGKCVPCCKSLNHVPLIVHAPGSRWPRRVAATVSGADICPTLCDLAGIAPPGHQHGESLRAVVQHGRRDLAMVQHYTPTLARQNLSVYDDRFRYTWYTHTGEFELYDHDEDPHELVNRAGVPAFAAEQRRLHAALADLQCRTCSPRAGRVAVW